MRQEALNPDSRVMNILLVSSTLPSLGGLETMARLIAIQWQSQPDLNLRIMTDVSGGDIDGVEVPILRQPSIWQMIQAYRWADVVFFNHCYLRLSLPRLLIRRPYVVSMSGMIPPGEGLKHSARIIYLRHLLKHADGNIVACEAMRLENKVDAQVIVNPFDATRYHVTTPLTERPYDFIFAGRVNSIKGVIDMVHALAKLRDEHGLKPIISVAGDGDHRELMLETATSLNVRDQIRYLGILRGEDLAREMNLHRCILVPSNYIEPIGICCLEGIACGCVAIGSVGGGLGESVGPCGFTFPNGDIDALTSRMKTVLELQPEELEAFHSKSKAHLAKYSPQEVMSLYLEAVKKCL